MKNFNYEQICWRTVLVGILLQLIFAILILRIEFGFMIVSWIGRRVAEFFTYTNAGAQFVFGQHYRDHLFAFAVLLSLSIVIL